MSQLKEYEGKDVFLTTEKPKSSVSKLSLMLMLHLMKSHGHGKAKGSEEHEKKHPHKKASSEAPPAIEPTPATKTVCVGRDSPVPMSTAPDLEQLEIAMKNEALKHLKKEKEKEKEKAKAAESMAIDKPVATPSLPKPEQTKTETKPQSKIEVIRYPGAVKEKTNSPAVAIREPTVSTGPPTAPRPTAKDSGPMKKSTTTASRNRGPEVTVVNGVALKDGVPIKDGVTIREIIGLREPTAKNPINYAQEVRIKQPRCEDGDNHHHKCHGNNDFISYTSFDCSSTSYDH